MGWAKYLEDDMEIMQERNLDWNSSSFSYSQSQITIRHNSFVKTPCSEDRELLKGLLLGFLENGPVMKEATYKDKTLICKHCGRPFLFSASTQKHFAEKRWNPPKRCKACRSARETAFCMRPSF